MAVQAHYPSSDFMPEFRKRSRDALLADLQRYHEQSGGSMFLNHGALVLNGNTVFSDLESDLTCNVSASRKRSRDESHHMNLMTQEQFLQQQQQLRLMVNSTPKAQEKSAMKTISGLGLPFEDSRMNQSGGTSTSGRSQGHDSMAYIYQQQKDDTEALIRLHNDWLRLELEEKRKKHWRSVLSFVEQQVTKRLREKETALESARSRNAELEEKVKQMSVENQIWQNAARNSEAVVANLKSSLEKVLLLQYHAAVGGEGYGESEVGPSAAAVDDAQSYCFEGGDENDAAAIENEELGRRRMCRLCHENETSVLLLPCRHLCICKQCDSRLDSCPICNAHKSASLQVYLS